MKKQSGSALVAFLLIVIIGLFGVLGFLFWQNITKQTSTKETASTAKTSKESQRSTGDAKAYSLNDAVDGINTALMQNVCSGKAKVSQGDFVEVKDTDPFQYRPGKSVIDQQFAFAYVAYGCGSQGSAALMKRTDINWKIVTTDARIYPMCDAIQGEKFPSAIIDKCYKNDAATEPTAIQ